MATTHHRTAYFLELSLFDNVSGFSVLETRIAALPTLKDRGDAFEVFAQAYLATQKIAQAKVVWSYGDIPRKLKRDLSLSENDMGVDGLFETPLGEYNAYQVKFRTGRPPLTWGELSTFFGLTDQVNQRVLVTNCDALPAVINERSGFFCIRGSDLDRLVAADFEAIQRWLKSGEVAVSRKQPLPHQEEALAKILPALERHDRATAVLACGSGKTLLALWVAEQLGCKSILVLVPSLALVRQTLHEWLKETRLSKLSYLCVCSDSTVSKDADHLVVQQSDLDFPVTTDSAQVRQWLSRPFSGVRIVFSTYQSGHVVAEGMNRRTPFELCIFDEAHKTAGREGTRFSFALEDKNLPIRKRLFLTATPRHYDVQHKDKEGDARLVYSMDAPQVYGPIAHTLTFAEAARRGIVCDYKVVISAVTSAMVNEEFLRRGDVLIKGDLVRAQQVANQIAVQKAVEKYGVGRIFTFHRNVASAKSFTSPGGEGIQSHLSEFAAFHVNGTMPTAGRERVMREFAETKRAVISNARCLTEGVDVPAVDMVAFLSPKKSRVDIVQATGRAMRKAPHKKTGYVLVPLFLEMATGETIEQALTRTGFDDVWNVLEAMKEQDEILTDIIRQMREERGRVGGYDDRRFREKIEVLGPSLSLASLQTAITAECVERLGINWDERYGELKSYKERFGHCNVPMRWPENNELAQWVRTQRMAMSKRMITQKRIERLNVLGFIWDPRGSSWEEMFAVLVQYKTAHGHCNVPDKWPQNRQLSTWIGKQRDAKRKGNLYQERLQYLNALGFIWDARDASWDEMLSMLTQYKCAHGHCDVPARWPENPKLASWIDVQRRFKKKGTLSKERIGQLNEIGFIWSVHEASWEKMFVELSKFKAVHGHCNVPAKWRENPRLSYWVNIQRQANKKRSLSKDRIQCLSRTGFEWDLYESLWNEMFATLAKYKKLHGHCDVIKGSSENSQLRVWVTIQRQAKKKGKLSIERVRRLESLGFTWSVKRRK